MKSFIKSASLLFSLLFLSSCGKPDIRIKRKVAENEIVGTWQLDPKSSALAVDHDGDDYQIDSNQPHTIVFRTDGTCQYRSVLQMPTRHVEAVGEWSVVVPADDPKGSKIDMRLKMDDGSTYMFKLDFKEEAGELVIWEFWSDPDLWNFLEYKRKDAGQSSSGNGG